MVHGYHAGNIAFNFVPLDLQQDDELKNDAKMPFSKACVVTKIIQTGCLCSPFKSKFKLGPVSFHVSFFSVL